MSFPIPRAFIWLTMICLPMAIFAEEVGQPFYRTYSFEEIGNLSPGARLSSDQSGMIWVNQQGSHFSFDNQNWIDLVDSSDANRNVNYTKTSPSGEIYYGASGDWGRLQFQNTGQYKTVSLKDPNAPDWTHNTRFDYVLFTDQGIVFSGQNGIVFNNTDTGENHYFYSWRTVLAFQIGNEVFVSSYANGVQRMDLKTNRLLSTGNPMLDSTAFNSVTPWDTNAVIGITGHNQILIFDGKNTHVWETKEPLNIAAEGARILNINNHYLAYSETNEGLFILRKDGSIFRKYSNPIFKNITDFHTTEQGVLWFSSGQGITKLIYDSPISVFDHRSGLALEWPKIFSHNGETLLINRGNVFQFTQPHPGAQTEFKKWNEKISDSAFTAESTPDGLLYGNFDGLFSITEHGVIEAIEEGISIDRIINVDPERNRYLVFAGQELIAIQWEQGKWIEFAPRIESIGYPSISHMTVPNSLWVELGLNRVARIQVDENKIIPEIYEDWNRDSPSWVNVGNIGKTTILIQGSDIRFFDETKKTFVERPDLLAIINDAPLPLLRLKQVEDGTIWVSHTNGIYLLHIDETGYFYDTKTLRMLRFNYPIFKILNGAVWILGEQVIHRIEDSVKAGQLKDPEPILISIMDSREKTFFYHIHREEAIDLPPLSYESNSLSFHFFTGSYALLRNPKFQYKLTGYSDDWSVPSQNPVIELTSLHEGDYTLNVRMLQDQLIVGNEFELPFTILPPIYRSWYGYLSYILLGVASVAFISRWNAGRIKRQALYLRELVERRTSELAIANKELKGAIKKAESASEAKSQFLANMSHEIRTPLNGSLGMCKLMEYTGLSKEQEDLLKTMKTSNESLLMIINDILDFSKIESGEITLEMIPFDLHSLFDETIDLTVSTLRRKHIELTYSIPDNLPKKWIGDPYRIRQVLLNLVSNAIKFTKDGFIHLEVDLVPDGNGLKFAVSDSGIGIKQGILEQLFKPFSQGDQSTSRRYGGTGLGLSISKMLTTHMGGEIWAESIPEKGSCFYFTIALKRACQIESQGAEADTVSDLSYDHAYVFTNSDRLRKQIGEFLEIHEIPNTFLKDWNAYKDQFPLASKNEVARPLLIIDEDLLMSDRKNLDSLKAFLGSNSTVKTLLLHSIDESNPRDIIECSSITFIRKPLRYYQFLHQASITDGSVVQQEIPKSESRTEWEGNYSKNTKILLVEDNLVNQKVARLMLKRLKLECDIASNGHQAVQKFNEGKYHLILMDIQMPGMDGIEATERILESCDLNQKPTILAMSAGVSEDERSTCEQVGMAGFIPKPVNLETLKNKLQKHLQIPN